MSAVAPIARARARGFGLGVEALEPPTAEAAAGDGWRPATALVHDAALREDVLARATAVAGSPAVAATWIVEKHAWLVAGIAVAATLTAGAVPRLDDLCLRDAAAGWPEAACIPRSAPWSPVADGAALACRLHGHLAPLICVMSAHRAARPLWRSAGDRLGQAALWCGEAFGDPDGAQALATAALTAPTALQAPPRFADGTRRRSGCCLAHRVPGLGRCEDCAVSPGR